MIPLQCIGWFQDYTKNTKLIFMRLRIVKGQRKKPLKFGEDLATECHSTNLLKIVCSINGVPLVFRAKPKKTLLSA